MFKEPSQLFRISIVGMAENLQSEKVSYYRIQKIVSIDLKAVGKVGEKRNYGFRKQKIKINSFTTAQTKSNSMERVLLLLFSISFYCWTDLRRELRFDAVMGQLSAIFSLLFVVVVFTRFFSPLCTNIDSCLFIRMSGRRSGSRSDCCNNRWNCGNSKNMFV